MRFPICSASFALAAVLAADASTQECTASMTTTQASHVPLTTSHADEIPAEDQPDLVELAASAGSFETLVTAVQAAGLVQALQGTGPFTIFAPSDTAFGQLPKGTVADLLQPKQREALTDILTYHVVPGRLEAADVIKASTLTTLNGQRLDVRVDDQGVMIDGARVVSTDIQASNGIIHVLDSVMLPARENVVSLAVADGRFKTLAAALTAADLVDVLTGDGPFTVFAPTDEAFASLPEGTVESLLLPENRERLVSILTYHVVAGRVFADQAAVAGRATSLQGGPLHFSVERERINVNGSSAVLLTDLEASNGVIHVVDSVLLPE